MAPQYRDGAGFWTRDILSLGAESIITREVGTENRVGTIYAVTLTFWIIALLVVCIRVFSRSFLTKFRGQDDWWMVAAAVFAAGDQALKIIWCENGLGRRVADVPLNQLTVFVKIGFAIAVLYPWSLGLVKISILAFYLRLFPHEKFRKVCYGIMGVVAAVTLASSLSQVFACSPISAAYTLDASGATCVNRAALQYASSVLNLVTDLVVLLLPMKYLLKLSGDKRKRYIVVVLFSLGILTCVASAFRLATIHSFYIGSDPTWDATNIALWSCAEINLTIITASIPAIKPFFDKLLYRPACRLLGKSYNETTVDTDKNVSELSTGLSRKYTLDGYAARKSNTMTGSKTHSATLATWNDSDLSLGSGEPVSRDVEGGRNMDFYAMLQQSQRDETGGVINALNNPAAFKLARSKFSDSKDSDIDIEEICEGTNCSRGS